VLDCGIEQLVGLSAGDAGMPENVLVKFRIGQLQLKESEVACQRAGESIVSSAPSESEGRQMSGMGRRGDDVDCCS